MGDKIGILSSLYYKALKGGYDGQLVLDKYKIVIYDHKTQEIEYIDDYTIDYWIANFEILTENIEI